MQQKSQFSYISYTLTVSYIHSYKVDSHDDPIRRWQPNNTVYVKHQSFQNCLHLVFVTVAYVACGSV